MELINGALQVMGIGVSSVFIVLAAFFGLVKLLIFLFPAARKEDQ